LFGVVASGVRNVNFLILGGDLNFTLNANEVWGVKAKLNPHEDFFHSLLEDEGLVDLALCPLKPTWRNGREGVDGILKRLDRFMLNQVFMRERYRSRSWVINSIISDHNLIFLQVEGSDLLAKYPFKFHHAWLKEVDFKELVVTNW